MHRWSLAFFIGASVAGIFGFGGFAAGAAEFARACFFFFFAAIGVTLMLGLPTGKKLPSTL